MTTLYEYKFDEDEEEPLSIDGDFYGLSELAEQMVEINHMESAEYSEETDIWVRKAGTEKWTHFVVYMETSPSYTASEVQR